MAYLPGPVQLLIAHGDHGLKVAGLSLALIETGPEPFELGHHIGRSNKQSSSSCSTTTT